MHMLESYPDTSIINLDLLTYEGNLENLQDTAPYADRYGFERGDIADRDLVCNLVCNSKPDVVVNFAAESHVDRSIMDCSEFLRTNVVGTQVLLETCRE